jgi:hypothetical protein
VISNSRRILLRKARGEVDYRDDLRRSTVGTEKEIGLELVDVIGARRRLSRLFAEGIGSAAEGNVMVGFFQRSFRSGCCGSCSPKRVSHHQLVSIGLLLAQRGVLCLGVGDAMGAVVGKGVGRHQWGKNGRTLEGSSAMWVSMVAVGLLAVPSSDWMALLTGTTIATLLEAFTLQMDNLVLPLAGSTVLLLMRR